MFSLSASDFAADAIEREVAHEELFGRGLAAAQQDARAGEQFDESEGLDEIIVCALFQTFDAVVYGIAGAEDQDRGNDFAVADFFEYLEAIDIGQA